MGHHIDRIESPCATDRPMDREQAVLDAQEAEARLARLARCLAAEDGARDMVRQLSRQLRSARLALRRASLERAAVVAAEMRRQQKER